jgi:hypothetical protein
MAYVVFEDLMTSNFITNPADVSLKIHREDCRHYKARKSGTTTVRWSDLFESLAEAEEFAKATGKTWARAKCCP